MLICGIYVDLNQIRAGEVVTPEESRHCSIWYRIQARGTAKSVRQPNADRWLAPLTLGPNHLGDVPSHDGFRASDKGLLDVSLDQYLQLLDCAGRQVRTGKHGVIPASLAPILARLGIAPQEFLDTIENFPRLFPRMVGKAEQLLERAYEVNRRWLHGVAPAAWIFT